MLGDIMPGNFNYSKISVLVAVIVLMAGFSSASLEVGFKDSQKDQAFINTAYSLNFDVIASSTDTDASNLEKPRFNAEFEGTDLSISGDLDSCDSVTGKKIVPDLNPGIYTLNLEVFCEYPNGSKLSGSENLQVNINRSQRAKASQNPAGDLSLNQVRNNGLTLNVEYWDGYEKRRPQADNFYLNVYKDDRKVYQKKKWFEGVRKEDSVELSLQTAEVPELKTGEYVFELMLDTEGMDEPLHIKDVEVTKNLVFSGKVDSPSGQGVKAKFEFGSYSFETDKNGEYSKRITPGTYDMDLKFPETTLKLQDVEIKEGYRGGITYDYYSLNEDLNVTGLDAVNLMGVAFGYPVGNASITTEYDFGSINWKELEVFECQNWNLGKGCHSDWSVVDSQKVDIVPWSGEASFPVKATEFEGGNRSQKILINSYVVGRNEPMRLKNFEVASKEVYVNKEFKAKGIIESGNGDPVENADVEISISGEAGDKRFTTETDSQGRFETDLQVPRVGKYSLKLKAEKSPYSPVEKSTENSIRVVKKRSLGVESPSSLEMNSGETEVLETTLKNTGQAEVEDIEVSASVEKINTSINNKNVFDSLAPGESSKININTTVPQRFCEGGCGSYPVLEIAAKGSSGGETIQESSSVTLVVSKSASGSGESREKSEEGSSFSLPEADITGKFLEAGPGLNQVLAGLMAIILIAAVLIKKKKPGGREPRRGLVENRS